MRSHRRNIFFKKHPNCCYCGGNTPATTIDHVPSRQLFPARNAAFTLRLPACERCNGGTSESEQVAAFVARFAYGEKSVDGDAELIEGFIRHSRDVAEEVLPRQRQVRKVKKIRTDGEALNASGPHLNYHMQTLGVKMGLAIYYHEQGEILPSQGGVWLRWWTNMNRLEGDILPKSLEAILSDPIHLKQGVMNSSHYFEYSISPTTQNGAMCIFLSYGFAFAMLVFLSPDPGFFEFIESDGATIHRPSEFLDRQRPLSLGRFEFRHT